MKDGKVALHEIAYISRLQRRIMKSPSRSEVLNINTYYTGLAHSSSKNNLYMSLILMNERRV